LDIAIFDSDLEDCLLKIWNLITWEFTAFKLLNEALNVLVDAAIAFG
jgi:hypothetical protein